MDFRKGTRQIKGFSLKWKGNFRVEFISTDKTMRTLPWDIDIFHDKVQHLKVIINLHQERR